MNEPKKDESSHFELFTHASDMGVRGRGKTIERAFENVGLALTSMVTDLQLVSPKESVKIKRSAPDLELLLLDWLNAIIYEMSTRNMLFCCYEVHIKDLTLEATLIGEEVDRSRHAPIVEPKAATFSELKVEQLPDDHWLVQAVIDI